MIYNTSNQEVYLVFYYDTEQLSLAVHESISACMSIEFVYLHRTFSLKYKVFSTLTNRLHQGDHYLFFSKIYLWITEILIHLSHLLSCSLFTLVHPPKPRCYYPGLWIWSQGLLIWSPEASTLLASQFSGLTILRWGSFKRTSDL